MNLANLLERYRTSWPEEEHVVQEFFELLQKEPDAFGRGTKIGHVTGSAWVVDPSREFVLLTHHRKLGIWVQLGGHADGESDILSVAKKEAEEESGIVGMMELTPEIFDIDIHRIPANSKEPEHAHYDVRFVLEAPYMEYSVSEESHDVAWIRISELSSVTSEHSMHRMASKWTKLTNELARTA